MSIKTYHIESLGCAKNLVDSEAFAFLLQKHAYLTVEDGQELSLVLINSCAFLQDALEELGNILDYYQDLKEAKEIGQLWVTGCVMNRALEEFKAEYPCVDQWIGLKDFAAFESLLTGSKQLSSLEADLHRIQVDPGFHAYLRISDGCSNHCSYCTIPSIRGPHKSVPIPVLVAEARALLQDSNRDISELIVIAQDSCSYGLDIYGRKALPELLHALHEIDGLKSIRIMYMHPDHFELSWLALWNELPKLLPFFEIPIQHSVTRILKDMGRKKGSRALEQLFHTIRQEVPAAVLRSTLICGYPSETEEEHEQMLSFLCKVKLDQVGVFSYSPEPGTKAYLKAEQLEPTLINLRHNQLLEMQERISEEMLHPFIGQTVQVLIESVIEDADEGEYNASGRCWFQAPDLETKTHVIGKNMKAGEIVKAYIHDCDAYSLYADLADDYKEEYDEQ